MNYRAPYIYFSSTTIICILTVQYNNTISLRISNKASLRTVFVIRIRKLKPTYQNVSTIINDEIIVQRASIGVRDSRTYGTVFR